MSIVILLILTLMSSGDVVGVSIEVDNMSACQDKILSIREIPKHENEVARHVQCIVLGEEI